MANNQDHWQWQNAGAAWHGAGIYHVTLVVPNREPLLGSLIIPDDDPAQAYIERTELGEKLVDEIYRMGSIHPQIRILQFCLMPDHLHVILHKTQSSAPSIRAIVRGFWQGAKRLGRSYTMSINPACPLSFNALCTLSTDVSPTLSIDPEFNSGTTNKVDLSTLHQSFPIFTTQPFIRPLSRHGQLEAMMQYVRLNPQRLATKQLMPGFFRVQHNLSIGDRTYDAVGNAAILQAERYTPVHVRRKMIEAAALGNDQPLRDYMNSCVLAARKGTVMVSPFISHQEKAVLEVLLRERRPIIYLADNGFSEYYKPSSTLFDAVAAGEMLILSPWQHDPDKRHISRGECVALNGMAEEICTAATSSSH